MDLNFFSTIFSVAIENRDNYLTDPYLEPWFQNMKYPPILGFGLPRIDEHIPIVSIGLNPSSCEIKNGHIPADDEVNDQLISQINYFKNPYSSWFNKAEDIINHATGGRVTYGGVYDELSSKPRCTHLDLSPLPTKGMFDSKYGEKNTTQESKNRALQMLNNDFELLLLPMLRHLQARHRTHSVLLFGYCPRCPNSNVAGSMVMKKFWGQQGNTTRNKFVVSRNGKARGISWAYGTWHLDDGLKFNIGFLSQGPSSTAKLDNLNAASENLEMQIER